MQPARALPHPAARASASYAPREPRTTALYQVMQAHLGTFLQSLRRTFGIDLRCLRCHGDLRLIALVKEEATITKILGAMGLDTKPLLLASARAPPHQAELAWGF